MPNTDKKSAKDDKSKRDAFGNVAGEGSEASEVAAEVTPNEPEEPETPEEKQPEPEKEPEESEESEESKKEVPPDLVPETSSQPVDSEEKVIEPKSEAGDEPEEEPKEDPEPESEPETTPFDDENTDRAINDIVSKESDDALAVQDAAAAKGKVEGVRGGLWTRKWFRRSLLFLFFGGIAAVATVPVSRYWILNTAGVRSESSLVVVDSTTQLPLKGVDITLAGKDGRTDSDGKVTLNDLKLGATRLEIKQVGFETISKSITIGWGSNPLGSFSMNATGIQYVIQANDYLTDQPLEGVEATNGDATAISDKDGKITLTLENTTVAASGVTLSKEGYRSDTVTLNPDPTVPTDAVMVINRKSVFVSRTDGLYNVYKSDIDGKNRDLVLSGTGEENSNLSLVVSADGSRAAYVSTREGKRDSSGFLLSSLVLINVETGSTLTIAESAQIQLIDWIGSRLIFQLGGSDSNAANRYTVISYDHSNNTRLQLAAANRMQAVISARGAIYYAPADGASADGVGLFKIDTDGSDKQQVFDQEVSTILRSSYNNLSLQTSSGSWVSYDLASGEKVQTATPSSLANRLYIDNSSRTSSLWISQGVLRKYDIAAGADADMASLSGMNYPLQWVGSSAAIFRVSNATETADYVVSLSGGTPHKITDVTPAYGFSQAQ